MLWHPKKCSWNEQESAEKFNSKSTSALIKDGQLKKLQYLQQLQVELTLYLNLKDTMGTNVRPKKIYFVSNLWHNFYCRTFGSFIRTKKLEIIPFHMKCGCFYLCRLNALLICKSILLLRLFMKVFMYVQMNKRIATH